MEALQLPHSSASHAAGLDAWCCRFEGAAALSLCCVPFLTSPCFSQMKAWRPLFDLTTLTGTGLLTPPQKPGGGCCWATVKSSTELLGRGAEPGASTKLLTLDTTDAMCGNYSPGELSRVCCCCRSLHATDDAQQLRAVYLCPALSVDCFELN